MKKFVLFVMLMMCVVSVSAQRWSLTPEVGMTAISRGGGFYSDEQKWNSRWKMGVGVEYAVKPDFFSLKSGLYYTQRGYSYHTITYGSIYPTGAEQSDVMFGEIRSKRNSHILQVPLMANFSFRLADDVRLNLAAGPYVGYSLGDKDQYSYMEYTPGTGYGYGGYSSNGYYDGNSYGGGWVGTGFGHEGWTHDNPFDWGFSLQVGVEVKQWVMNVGYEASLGKEYKYDKCDLKYHTLSLSVGYKFKLGK
ncbi:outer membrane beta-barrel protein [uncultured Parabacteroides sp.]|uniref:outer membrane beta-barrel protein n=1 Tax=uncultured Parabacteroides sp. TaxID=512312 RepID=UPI0025F03C90|nr:outer membrane beta-barrel protein [uncultured Parabacteroides sp.]